MMRGAWCRLAVLAAAVAAAGALHAQALRVAGDGVPEPLAAQAGDAGRGRALLVARESANCVLCHAVPDPAVRFSGNVGPSLAGVGTRLSAAQLRLRIADSTRLNPDTVMPGYYRTDGLDRVAAAYRGKPVLSALEVEDVIAYLVTLR
ncbi:MAG: sulfur oxidation c-type cytochrome SoxX [Burkholderiales bacterium]